MPAARRVLSPVPPQLPAVQERDGYRACFEYGGNMAERAVVSSQSVERRWVAFALMLALPIVVLWWATAHAEPMRLTPPSVESVALNEPMSAPAVTAPAQTPPPALEKKRRYNVVVLGDSLGDGTWAGLYHVLRK